MPVSANTLFHFTTLETLQKILKSKGFWAQYSLEHFENVLPVDSDYITPYIPMACFCDLKLMQLSDSNISKHTLSFGKYGIGFKKKWGMDNNISPVLYVHKQSISAATIDRIITNINASENVDEELILELGNVLKFLKPHEGYFQKKRRYKEPITYYDEREWRFIPPDKKFIVLPHTRRNTAKVKQLNLELQGKPLRFIAEDIKYIVIKEEGEKPIISKAIDGMRLKVEDSVALKSRILTFKQLEEDF